MHCDTTADVTPSYLRPLGSRECSTGFVSCRRTACLLYRRASRNLPTHRGSWGDGMSGLLETYDTRSATTAFRAGNAAEPCNQRVKVKLALLPATKAGEEQRYSSTLSLTSALYGGEGSTPHPGHFTPEMRPRTHCRGG